MSPIFPNQIEVSKDISLSKLTDQNAELVRKLYSDKNNVKYMDEVIVNWKGDKNRAKRTINIINNSATDFVWVINYKDIEVGLIGLENINRAKDYCEVWYLLDTKYQGKGIMEQTLKHLMHIFSTNLSGKIVATAKVDNISSINLLKKTGFIESGKRGDDRVKFVFSSNLGQ